MFKKTSYAVMGALMLGSALMPLAASAQTYTTTASGVQAVMPVLYNASGQPVNVNTTGPLAAGYYYLGTGATQQVYYYGNGVFYNPGTGVYGGSAVNDPNGTSGVALGYSTDVTNPSSVTTTPGVPNTGAGGEATATWITLILAALVVAGGVAYLVTTRPARQM
jgi:hypothetical protein